MMDRFKAMTERTHQVLAKAEVLYGVKINPTIAYNLKGRVAGFASCKYCMLTGKARDFSLRFNREIIQGDHFEDMMNLTVPHEVAHLVAMSKPALGARGHNSAWKRICIALGGNGARTHNYDVVVRGRWDYITDRGNKVSVTKRYHAAVQAGVSLTFKRGLGTITKSSPHAPSGQLKVTPKADGTTVVRTVPAPTSAPKQVTRTKRTVEVSKTGELTWAEKVRRLIRAQKALGVSMDTVIVLAIMDLGMTRERAKSCVKAHWDKV